MILQKTRRSQVSFEMLFCIGAVLFLFIMITSLCFARESYMRQTRNYVDLRDSCQKVSNLITETYASGEGASFSVRLYDRVEIIGEDGSLEVYDKGSKNEAYCSFPLRRVTNTTNTSFTLYPGMVYFRFNEVSYFVEVTQ